MAYPPPGRAQQHVVVVDEAPASALARQAEDRLGKHVGLDRAVLARAAEHAESDTLRRRVERGGQRITLSQKEYTLLELLARRRGEVLPRSLIASQVWDMNFDSDTNVIDVAIRRLRAKIDDDFDAKLIVTVRGMGYVLEAPDDGAVHSG